MSHDQVTEEESSIYSQCHPQSSFVFTTSASITSKGFLPFSFILSHKHLAGTTPAPCMSIGPYPSPFSSTAPIPLHPVQDIRDQLWSYRLQCSLETNWSSPPFIHQPYYLPFSVLDAGFTAPPFLLSALHYFEWCSTLHGYPLIIVQIHISPAFAFQNPIIHIVTFPQYSCSAIHVFVGNFLAEF